MSNSASRNLHFAHFVCLLMALNSSRIPKRVKKAAELCGTSLEYCLMNLDITEDLE